MLIEICEQNKMMLAQYQAGQTQLARKTQLDSTGLPPFSEIGNFELTYFDNGADRGKGNIRFRVKAEINLTDKTDFKTGRDTIQWADLYPLWDIDAITKRRISDDYRDRLREEFNKIPAADKDRVKLGLFGRRGGKSGQTWFEHQYIMTFHDDNAQIIAAVVNRDDQQHVIRRFHNAHLNGKPFATETIKAKSVTHPCRDAERDIDV